MAGYALGNILSGLLYANSRGRQVLGDLWNELSVYGKKDKDLSSDPQQMLADAALNLVPEGNAVAGALRLSKPAISRMGMRDLYEYAKSLAIGPEPIKDQYARTIVRAAQEGHNALPESQFWPRRAVDEQNQFTQGDFFPDKDKRQILETASAIPTRMPDGSIMLPSLGNPRAAFWNRLGGEFERNRQVEFGRLKPDDPNYIELNGPLYADRFRETIPQIELKPGSAPVVGPIVDPQRYGSILGAGHRPLVGYHGTDVPNLEDLNSAWNPEDPSFGIHLGGFTEPQNFVPPSVGMTYRDLTEGTSPYVHALTIPQGNTLRMPDEAHETPSSYIMNLRRMGIFNDQDALNVNRLAEEYRRSGTPNEHALQKAAHNYLWKKMGVNTISYPNNIEGPYGSFGRDSLMFLDQADSPKLRNAIKAKYDPRRRLDRSTLAGAVPLVGLGALFSEEEK